MAPNAQNNVAATLPHLAIVDKINELPLVHSALDYANSRYAALKGSSQLVNATLDRAEKSIQLVVTTGTTLVVPVLNKLEQPIHYADNIAVQGLDLAVAKIGSIQKSGGELKDSTLKVVDQTKERLSAARATMLTLPSNVVPLLDQILNAGENVLDYLMPEKEGTGASKPATNGTAAPKPEDTAVLRVVIYRVRQFSDKVRTRIVDYSRDRWIPALFTSALVIQRNVISLVANGAAAKLLANGHSAAAATPSTSASTSETGATSNNSAAAAAGTTPAKGPANSTPKKSPVNSSATSPASSNASSSPANSANGDVKKQPSEADNSYDSVTSS